VPIEKAPRAVERYFSPSPWKRQKNSSSSLPASAAARSEPSLVAAPQPKTGFSDVSIASAWPTAGFIRLTVMRIWSATLASGVET